MITAYILIILAGNESYTNSSTAEFNSLESCQAAIALTQNAATENRWRHIDVLMVCVPK